MADPVMITIVLLSPEGGIIDEYDQPMLMGRYPDEIHQASPKSGHPAQGEGEELLYVARRFIHVDFGGPGRPYRHHYRLVMP